MKAQRSIITSAAAALLGSAGTTCAAESPEVAGGFLIWGFLGFCALIIVGQLVPAVMLLIGLAKGVASAPDEAKPTDSK